MRVFPKDIDSLKDSKVRYCGVCYPARIENISKTGNTIKAHSGGNLHIFSFSENTDCYHTGNGYTLILE